MNSSAKGSTFEREIATQLSLWFTGGKNDRVFWRSASSGAMATTRSKQGKTTSGGYGDITAIDPIGAPLTDRCVIELKKGYNEQFDPLWILDRLNSTKPTPLEAILIKLFEETKVAGRTYPVLIFKRDRRQAMIAVSSSFIAAYHARAFADKHTFAHGPCLVLNTKRLGEYPHFSIFTLEHFLANCRPDVVCKM